MKMGLKRGFLKSGFNELVKVAALLLLSAQAAHATPRLEAKFERDSVGVGEHITLSLEVEKDMMQVIAFPDFAADSVHLEQVSEPTLDTMESSGRRLRIRRQYKFRSFEPGFYNMGRVSVLSIDKNVVDTITSADSLRFMVGMFLIDSTSQGIFDLKAQRDLPFKFEEISNYALWALLALVLLAVAAYVTLRILARMGHSVFGMFKPKPPVAPHVAAFAALETLRKEHLWQAGEYKGYYSRLTDIIRTYISGRYGVAAMEMTTPEIIAASKELELPRRCEMELQELLRDADLVKFAKAQFEASQNEQYFETVRLFVDLTKPEEEEDAEEVVEEAVDVAEPTEEAATTEPTENAEAETKSEVEEKKGE